MNSFRTVFQRVSRNAFQAKRSMAGHAHSGPNKWAAANKEFGIELHEASNFHKGAANILLVTMWVWVMYRTKEDKGKMFVSNSIFRRREFVLLLFFYCVYI